MNEEYFADGMTEELIDKLSKIPGLRVPAPTSSFYFKGKRVTVADVANSLGVAYILDGSVRKSDATLRIAARLVRAADGYVVWSETYDRPLGDKLWVQDDIAQGSRERVAGGDSLRSRGAYMSTAAIVIVVVMVVIVGGVLSLRSSAKTGMPRQRCVGSGQPPRPRARCKGREWWRLTRCVRD